jgi:outer membrane protein assembly factor BamB
MFACLLVASAAVAADAQIVGWRGNGSDIEALDAKTGAVAWTRPICKDPENEHWWSAIGGGFCPLNIGGVPMFMTSNTDIYRTADGQQVFLDNPMAYYQLAAPVVDGNTVCNVKNDGRVYILKLPAGTMYPSSTADRTLLQCVSWDTGEVKWTHAGFGFSPVVAADGKLILITDDGELVVAEASPKAYKELARAKVFPSKSKSWVCPVLCGGRIYCRGGENAVCLDVKGQ